MSALHAFNLVQAIESVSSYDDPEDFYHRIMPSLQHLVICLNGNPNIVASMTPGAAALYIIALSMREGQS